MPRKRYCRARKLYLVDFWRNSDLEFSQKVNAQNGTSHSSLQKSCCKKLALKLHSFFNAAPKGDWLPICPFEKGARWVGILAARNNAQCCSSVNQIPVICQFVCEKNQSSIGGEMHCHGSGVCWIGRRTKSGLEAS
jgi:hypothetical protein